MPAPTSDAATASIAEPGHLLECATSGRSKCRACGKLIDKGSLRFGERAENPFTEGHTTYWFHPRCAAFQRGTQMAELGEAQDLEQQLWLAALAAQAHPRLERLCYYELAPSGRAKCRQCREPIPKGEWRASLGIFEGGRLAPIGKIHLGCQAAYFGTSVETSRIQWALRDLSQEAQTALLSVLSSSG